uniref:Uncharacterized protein n=1 Tax=Candidatus Kentrum sp. TC TaxID=2126339 RepID=A0A450Z0F2_9GAMM|nr:MAG: hypothetical protein BECKTC1821E_GA0114239_10803 [Candidatus Kentron sp. TC]VFK63523.1 MAG: hypothetical protein BECKTC1821F_GA0114240_10983 [Candidatus Kentron sp. TC]
MRSEELTHDITGELSKSSVDGQRREAPCPITDGLMDIRARHSNFPFSRQRANMVIDPQL